MRTNRVQRRNFRFAACVTLGAALAPSLIAQEALRISRAGEEAAAARQIFREREKQTFAIGEGKVRLGASLAAEYNSNITLVEEEAESDVIFRPQVMAALSLPVTDVNYFSLAVAAGYSKYVSHSEYDRPFILPGSEISFDFFIKDVRLTLEDRFTYSEDPAERAVVTGTAEFGGFQNVAGLSALADLNDLTISASYNHLLFLSTVEAFDHLDRSSHQISASASIHPKPFLETGIQTGITPTKYFDSFLRDNLSYSAGAFLAATISTHLSASARGGAVFFDYSDSEESAGGGDVQNIYFGAGLEWQPRKSLKASLNAGQESQLGVNQDLVEFIYVRSALDWTVNQRISARLSASYEDGEEAGLRDPEEFQRLIISPSATWNWREDWFARLSWSYIQRESAFANRSYDNHRVILTLGYEH